MLQGAVLVYFFWIPGLGSSQGWMFPRVGHQGEQGSGCVAWERSGMDILEVISVPFPSLPWVSPPIHAVLDFSLMQMLHSKTQFLRSWIHANAS